MASRILELRPEHLMAYRLAKQGHTDTAGASVMDVSRETFNRYKNHANRMAKLLIAQRAVGGDPIEALDEVRKVLAYEPRGTRPAA